MGRRARAINGPALTRLPRWTARAKLAYSKYRHYQQTDAATAAAAETTTSASAAAAASSSLVSGMLPAEPPILRKEGSMIAVAPGFLNVNVQHLLSVPLLRRCH